MNAETIIGNFENPETREGVTHITVKQPVRDFQLDWRRYNLVSNYFAEYSSFLFEQKDRAENLISTVLYELTEGMARCAEINADILIRLITLDRFIIFELATVSTPEKRTALEETVKIINRNDLDNAYFSIISSDKPEQPSGVYFGFVLIAHDYKGRFALNINPKNNVVTLRVAITKEEIYS